MELPDFLLDDDLDGLFSLITVPAGTPIPSLENASLSSSFPSSPSSSSYQPSNSSAPLELLPGELRLCSSSKKKPIKKCEVKIYYLIFLYGYDISTNEGEAIIRIQPVNNPNVSLPFQLKESTVPLFYSQSIALMEDPRLNYGKSDKYECIVQIAEREWRSRPILLRKSQKKKDLEAIFNRRLKRIDDFLFEFFKGYTRIFQEGTSSLPSPSSSSSSKRQRTTGADIAYWHPIQDLADKPQPGEIIAIRDSYVSKNTDGKCMLSVVPFPDMPYQICREPDPEEREKSVLVTYLGEVETKIRGTIIFTPNTDHYVLASGKNDGYGVVKAMEEITPDERYWIVGRVVRADNIRIEEDNSFVQTLICINFASIGTSGLKHELAQLSERVEETNHREERSIPLPNQPRLTSVPPPPKPRWWERIVDPFQMERPDLSVSYSNDTLGVVIAKHDLVKTEQLILDGNLDLNRLLLLCPEARYTCEILPSFYPSPDRPDVYASIKPLCLAIALQHYEMIRLLFAYGAEFDILC